MLTETRLRKTGAVEPLPAAIGADAAASGREAELERRPNGVSRSGAPFGNQTIARAEEMGSFVGAVIARW